MGDNEMPLGPSGAPLIHPARLQVAAGPAMIATSHTENSKASQCKKRRTEEGEEVDNDDATSTYSLNDMTQMDTEAPKEDEGAYTVAAQFGNDTAVKSAYLFTPRRSAKFPIMRPRLRTTTRSPLPDPPPTTPRQENLQVKRQAVLESVLKQADIFELSSSDFSPAVAWPVPRRPASRRFRPNAVPQPSTSRPLLKLRQPKPTRPPAYSLDGFVPKPSIIRITTTEAPPHIRKLYATPKTEAPPFRKNTPRFGSKKSKTKPLTNDYDDDGHFRKGRKHQDSGGRKSVQRIMGSRGPRKGIPGIDYPNFHRIPTTGFDCNDKQFPGMYADTDAGCQVWHMCTGVPNLGARHSFLCPNGTIFNERRGVCDWWYNVECSEFTL
ncbi:hypothetical protein HPB52_018705 [Rhipicephalus sanguineus]|uniref:Chitin-binding type-2 domain-containing protein n=1 Tax=Rhipicephalus sanguineus TaxID=34632 RepID=A0A9D4SUZ0_RHISA|nr:hypothetical protein HPB52_018705 [Rhipicephalus sanguineus]